MFIEIKCNMNTAMLYIKNNINSKVNEILFIFIEKSFDEKEYSFNNNDEYIKRNIIKQLVPFNLNTNVIFNKKVISFEYYKRKCDIIEYMNKYWIVTIYPLE